MSPTLTVTGCGGTFAALSAADPTASGFVRALAIVTPLDKDRIARKSLLSTVGQALVRRQQPVTPPGGLPDGKRFNPSLLAHRQRGV